MYDIIVVGAGPAGLTAALYARRAEKSVLILEKSTFGGQMTYSPKIENYPTVISASGNELADKMVEQVLAQGAEIDMDTVTALEKTENGFTVKGEAADYEAKSVILALGAKHRMLGLEGEASLVGNGISFCAVCDGAFYKGRTVAVIGGGNSALQEAILLSEGCEKVYVVQNLPEFTGETKLVNILKTKTNVEFIMGTVVDRLVGDSELTAIVLKDGEGTERELALDGMFVAIGLAPCNTPFEALAPLNKYGYFDTDETCKTATPGLFVAGDCRSKTVRQISTAIADGSAAAIAACRFLEENA
ncbi:MAG: FAD-dependent oxidoreductase [Clostridia bacterium]|nr:FAD-dependent oxidoreductase [Clostridia bacterium]